MKRTVITNRLTAAIVALVLPLVLVACADVGDAAEAETGEKVDVSTEVGDATYNIDPATSSVDWVGAKVTLAHDGGFEKFAGTLDVTDGNLSKVVVDIETPSIFSDDEKLTGHLMSPDFFNVETYPTARFEASTFEPYDSVGVTHMVTGNLTMLDQTKSIRFPANITVGENEVRATADFIIDRTNWGIVYPGMQDDLIRNDVRIKLDVNAKPQS